jgi:polyphenol oxidase
MNHVSHSPTPITSPRLEAAGFRHGFFTREGGVSTGPYASLNLSETVGDSPANVAENLARVANWLRLAPSELCWQRQVHGCDVVVLRGTESSLEVRSMNGDAVIVAGASLAACVRTADCVPILIADQELGHVAAVHAGWRGIVAGVLPETLARLFELGSKPACLIAAIGPHIGVRAFEVSEEVGQRINAATPHVNVVHRDIGDRPHVALVESATEQLRILGLNSNQIDDVGGCTFADSNRFFSYRRSGPNSGRHLNAIRPR